MKINIKFVIILTVVFLAFILRAWQITEHSSFNRDQGRDLIYILNHLEQKTPILLGPKASVGDFYLGPFYYYLITPVVALFPKIPVAPAIFIALLDSLAAGIIVLIGMSFLNPVSGILAGVLYATSPLAIQFGRFAWNPNPIPLFTVIFIYFGLSYLKTHRLRDYLLMSLSVALAIHLHYQAILLMLPLLFITLLGLNRKIWLHILLGLCVGFVTFIPFLIYEIQHDYFNINNILEYFLITHKSWYERVTIPAFITSFIPSFITKLQGGYLLLGQLLFWAFLLFIVGFIFWKLISVILFSGEEFTLFKLSNAEVISLIFFLLVFGLRIFKGDKLDYYMAFLYPLPALIVAIFYDVGKKSLFRFVVVGLWLVLLIGNIVRSPLKEPLVNDIQRRESLAQQLMSLYPERQISLINGEENFTNPVRYFLLINHKLDEPSADSVTIKLCDQKCPSNYTQRFHYENIEIGESIDL